MKRGKTVARSDSRITNEELENAFAQWDQDKTGFIDIKKLKFVMRALGYEPRQREIDALTNHMLKNEVARSVNKDAFTMEELSYVLEKKIGVTDAKEEINSTFKLFDTSDKGFINFEDLKRISVELGENLADDEIKEMINEADQSRNGCVSQNDFEKIMKKTALY